MFKLLFCIKNCRCIFPRSPFSASISRRACREAPNTADKVSVKTRGNWKTQNCALKHCSCQFSPHYPHALRQQLPAVLHWDNPQREERSSRQVSKKSGWWWQPGKLSHLRKATSKDIQRNAASSVRGNRAPSLQCFCSDLNGIHTEHGEERKGSCDSVARRIKHILHHSSTQAWLGKQMLYAHISKEPKP